MPAGFTGKVNPADCRGNSCQITKPPSMFQVTPVMNPDSR